MGYSTPQGQIPVLCKECGGACTPGEDFSLACKYCGAKDQLPADELGRALELKRRVQKTAAQVAQLSGVQSALATIFEDRGAFLRVSAPWLVIAAIVTVQQVVGSWGHIAAAPANLRPALMVYAAMGSLFTSGIALAFMLALLVGRISYRKQVRPQLFARPPREAGRPSRCRGCGGDLPDDRGPFIRCRYCNTHNLVTKELQADRTRLLDEEERRYRQKSIAAGATGTRAASSMTRVLVVAIVIAYLSMFGLAQLGTHLLKT